MRKQKVFRIKLHFKKLISYESIDKNINNSDLVNKIISDFNFNNLDISVMKTEPKLSKENVQVIYRLDDINIQKIEKLAKKHNIKYSNILNHVFEFYFSKDK